MTGPTVPDSSRPRRRLAAALFFIAALPTALLFGLGFRLIETDRVAEAQIFKDTLRSHAGFLADHIRLSLLGLASGGAEVMPALRDPGSSMNEIEARAKAAAAARPELLWFEIFDADGRILGPRLDLPFTSGTDRRAEENALVPFNPDGDESVESAGIRAARMLALRDLYSRAVVDFRSGAPASAVASLMRVLVETVETDLRGKALVRLAEIRMSEGKIDDAQAVCEKYIEENPGGVMDNGVPARASAFLILSRIWQARGKPDRSLECLFWLWDDLLKGRLQIDREVYKSLGLEIDAAVGGILAGEEKLRSAWIPRREKFARRQADALVRDSERRLFAEEILPGFLKAGAPGGADGFRLISAISNDRLHMYLLAPPVAEGEWGEPSPGLAFRIDAEHVLSKTIAAQIEEYTRPLIDCRIIDHRGKSVPPGGDRTGGDEFAVEIGIMDEVPSLRLRAAAAGPVPVFGGARLKLYVAILAVSVAAVAFAAAFIFRTYAREQELARIRSEFVSNVTHELKTPLTSINMFADMLRRGRVQSPDKQKEYFEIIHGEGERLARLIDNVLDFARIEAGRKTYNPVGIDAAEIARRTAESASFAAKNSGFTVRVEAPDLPLMVTADPDAIERALLNLVSNAMKFSGRSREIWVRAYRKESSAALEVEDKGLGIRPEEKARIFQKFYRIQREGFEKIPGTGLGLSLVQSIVQSHGGTVEVESEPGKGSIFRMLLKLSD